MATAKPYRRLPGTGYRYSVPVWAIVLLFFVIGIFALLFRGRRVQLWQGAEHLMLVEWDGNREYYKRFNYRDIQALIVQKTVLGKVVNAILACVSGFFAAPAFLVSDPVGKGVLWSFAIIFGFFLALNALLGPTCQCKLRTAVQVEELPSLNRLKRARKAFARIRPLIVAAQGELVAAEIPDRLQRWLQAPVVEPRLMFDDPNAPPRMVS